MKSLIFKSRLATLILAVITSISVIAQQNKVKVMFPSNKSDSISDHNFYSAMFDIEDIGEMHQKIDSILIGLDDELEKKIKIFAFNPDSAFKGFHFNHHFDFEGNVDSMFSSNNFILKDKRIEELLNSHCNKKNNKDLRFHYFDGRDSIDLNNRHFKIITDSVVKNGNTVINKKIIIKDRGGVNDHSIVIKRFKDEEGRWNEEITELKNDHALRLPRGRKQMKKGCKQRKPIMLRSKHKMMQDIPLSDAALLVKAGISSKIITAPSLKPSNVEVKVAVKTEFGDHIKTVGISVTFDDMEDLEVKVLDSTGRTIFEETRKKFTGTYTKDLDVGIDSGSYYLLMIRNKKLFGKVINK